MRSSLPLWRITTRRLSAGPGSLTPCPTTLVVTAIIIGSRLDRNLHSQKVVCCQGFAFIFICHLRHCPRRCSKFHRKLAGSSSPCFTGLSLNLLNYGNPFGKVRTWGRCGEPASQGNGSFWEGRGTPSRIPIMNNGLSQLVKAGDGRDRLTSRRGGLGSVVWHPICQHMHRPREGLNVLVPLL